MHDKPFHHIGLINKEVLVIRPIKRVLIMEHEIFGKIKSEPRKVRWIWFVYVVLYAIAIPWYWPSGYIGPKVLGLPLWVATTLFAVFLLAVWTVLVIKWFWIVESEIES